MSLHKSFRNAKAKSCSPTSLPTLEHLKDAFSLRGRNASPPVINRNLHCGKAIPTTDDPRSYVDRYPTRTVPGSVLQQVHEDLRDERMVHRQQW